MCNEIFKYFVRISCRPNKVDNLEYCLRNLVALDATPVSLQSCEATTLLDISRDNAQLLINRIFSLPRIATPDGVFASLPKEDVITMPRMYPLPKPKPKTRWQLFAEARGIRKHKRSRMVFDKTVNDWVPRWGYKSIKKGVAANPPIVEVGDSDYAQSVDPFEEAKRSKNVQKTRQKLRELRNKAEANALSKTQSALQRAKLSTRSYGEFDKKTENVGAKPRIKRKVATVSLVEEKKSYLASIKKLNIGK
ncbi:regulator of ribosome biosynthesis, putative [Babesia bigemina]|uniref:Ribosome biogenesis regulatory protein n=1 Tax=Babesia bigemina TaxID=5866 RepID=A0A061D2D6_BABBI|nr:regulator of ribosome biosynthesis, putative [Babesia bigemina]CDR94257.1 regulator of ribosome biosynthesis, putative [Babesia bigemina]|eukprot:XP_012766443.1 regulator of ribosome biosynthesis, putative [Babesia bigemina]